MTESSGGEGEPTTAEKQEARRAPREAIEAIAVGDQDGWVVRAPRVGVFRGLLQSGLPARPGERVGTLEVLRRRIPVILPVTVDGVVTEVALHDRTQAVAYGDALYRIAPLSGSSALPRPPAPFAGARGQDVPLAEGCFAVPSPIDGVFYRGPSPGAPPFVDVGAQIVAGRTIGLIEAMKSFNAITYGGPGLPSPVVVVEFRAADASEIRQGTILMIVSAT